MVRAGGEYRGVRGPVALEKLLRPVLAEGGGPPLRWIRPPRAACEPRDCFFFVAVQFGFAGNTRRDFEKYLQHLPEFSRSKIKG